MDAHTGERYPAQTSKSVLNRTKSEAISNMRRWRKVIAFQGPPNVSVRVRFDKNQKSGDKETDEKRSRRPPRPAVSFHLVFVVA